MENTNNSITNRIKEVTEFISFLEDGEDYFVKRFVQLLNESDCEMGIKPFDELVENRTIQARKTRQSVIDKKKGELRLLRDLA